MVLPQPSANGAYGWGTQQIVCEPTSQKRDVGHADMGREMLLAFAFFGGDFLTSYGGFRGRLLGGKSLGGGLLRGSYCARGSAGS